MKVCPDFLDIKRTPVAILAGGLATRLRPLTEQIPKSLLEVAGRPFAEHQLEQLRQQGVKHVVFCVGFLGEHIRDALGDGDRWDMHLDYVFDGPSLLGTGGALKRALPLLGRTFFVIYGDSYLVCDYIAVGNAFHRSGKLALMTVYHNANQLEPSNIAFIHGQIQRYNKKDRTSDMHHIDYGLSVLNAEALSAYSEHKALDLETVYKDMLLQNQLAGYEVQQRFYEIGSPGGLEETRQYLSQRIDGAGANTSFPEELIKYKK